MQFHHAIWAGQTLCGLLALVERPRWSALTRGEVIFRRSGALATHGFYESVPNHASDLIAGVGAYAR